MTPRGPLAAQFCWVAAALSSACAGGVLEAPVDDSAPSTVSPAAGGRQQPPGGGVTAPTDPNRGADAGEAPPAESGAYAPLAATLPRLTDSQFQRSLALAFGQDLPTPTLEADTNPYLFYAIGAATTVLSEQGTELYAQAATQIASAVFSDIDRRARVLGCAPGAPDDACAEGFVRATGRRLFRRPLSQDEVDEALDLARDTAEGDPLRGLETVLAAQLQSPSFVYRVELGEPAGDSPAGPLRYSAFEMASRLAFLLTDAGPDDVLLDAAERGELLDDASVEAHARRLLDTPAAREAVQAFFAQYLDLARLKQVSRDPARYPGFTPTLLDAMETEVRLLVDDVVFRRRGDVRGLFSARRAYVNSELAALYAVEAPGATRATFVPVNFGPETPRAGLLTSGAFLTMNAHPTETSPTLRGKFVRERVLCQDVPPPPPDIDLDLARQAGEPPTLRERLEQHRTNPICAGCHAFIDPPGFLFEHYDSVGRFRTEAEGFPINSAGDLDSVPLNDALDLADTLSADPRVSACMTRQLFRHALARLDERSDRNLLKALDAHFAASGYDFQELLVALALSEAFRTVAVSDAQEAP